MTTIAPTPGESTTVDNDPQGSLFVTPGPGGDTPVLRYAWCLREKGLAAVVIGGENVAIESDGTGQLTPDGALAAIEKACAAAHPDYVAPNLNQR